MEYVVVRKNDELQHHGTKGMKWGRRLYQNKDGSLTPLGQKRYNKEVAKLKKETAKVKEAEKVAANRKKTQTKLDKLEAKKQALEERKKALKGEDNDTDNTPSETPEQRRERVLKSTNPKEIYENRDALTYNELNERVNRIDLEARLQNKIPVEHQKTGMDYMNDAKSRIDAATSLFRSVDNAYSAVANSAIGKTLAKQLGLEPPEKEWDYKDLMSKAHKLSPEKLAELNKATMNLDMINKRQKTWEKDEADAAAARQAKKEAEKAEKEAKKVEKEAKKAVDDYNKKWQKGESDDKVGNNESTYNKSGDDITDNKTATGKGSKTTRIGIEQVDYAKTDGKVYGEGTSKFSGWKNNDTVIDVDFREVVDSAGSKKMSNVSNDTTSSGRSAVAGLLPGPTKSSTKKQDVEYVKREKDGDSYKYTYDDDYNKAAEKALKNLQSAAKKSSDAVDRVSVDDDFVQEMLKRNDDMLKGK